MKNILAIIGALVVGLFGLVILVGATASSSSSSGPSATTAALQAADQGQKAPAQSVPQGITEGTYLVGHDIQPGTYRTAGAATDSPIPNCYWERLKGTSGELSDVIANGNDNGAQVVTIRASDVAFKTSGCQSWTKVK